MIEIIYIIDEGTRETFIYKGNLNEGIGKGIHINFMLVKVYIGNGSFISQSARPS
jgi:hypothetical protein